MVTLLWSLFGYKCIDYSNKLTKKMICLKTCFAVLHHFQVHKKVIYLPTNNLPTLKSNTMKNLMQMYC